MASAKSKDNLISRLRASRAKVLRPPRMMAVDEWADTYRRMSSAESSTPGRFMTSRVEACRGILQAVHEEGVRRISVMSATQLLKTTVLENVFGYHAHLDPCPIMILQPTQDIADAFVKEKLTPMIKNTPVLVEAFGGREALSMKSSENTIKRKEFRGGAVSIVSAGSPTNLRMRSVRVLLCDEVDAYPETSEGNAVSLAIERMEAFSHNSVLVEVCSPTVTGRSQIAESYEKSDQRRAYVACPHCGHEDHLRFENVKFDKEDTEGRERWESAAYMCPECGVLWTEQERIRILTMEGGVKWRQTRKFTCCGEAQDPQVERSWDEGGRALCKVCSRQAVPNRHAGFHASFLYSTRKHINIDVQKFLEAKGNKPKLRTFVNTRLAQTFEDDENLDSVELDNDVLRRRVEPPFDFVDDRVMVITAGLDVQDDRVEMEVVGWGGGEESWSLAYNVIDKSPGDDACWHEVDRILQEPLKKRDGTGMFIQAACVDSGGHYTQQVYAFCSTRMKRRVVPIKGASETSGIRSPIFPNSKVLPVNKPYQVGTNTAKDKIETMMRVEVPGPGFMHVPSDRADSWFKGMTSEKRIRFFQSGIQRTRWIPVYNGVRNEPLDCRVYSYAALEMLRRFKIIKGKSLAPIGTAIDDAPSALDQDGQKPIKRRPSSPHHHNQSSRFPGMGGGGFNPLGGGRGGFGGGGGGRGINPLGGGDRR